MIDINPDDRDDRDAERLLASWRHSRDNAHRLFLRALGYPYEAKTPVEFAQSALVIGELIKKSDEFQSIQQQIRDEANRKRAEAAEQGRVGRASVKAQEQTESLVVPTSMAALNHKTRPAEGDLRDAASGGEGGNGSGNW